MEFGAKVVDAGEVGAEFLFLQLRQFFNLLMKFFVIEVLVIPFGYFLGLVLITKLNHIDLLE